MYLDYEIAKIRYLKSRDDVETILEERERLFGITQPHSMQYDQDRVVTSPSNSIEAYIVLKEQTKIEQRLTEAKGILQERAEFLSVMEKDLRKSRDIEDRIYCMRYLDKLKIHKIKKAVHYSEAQIYRILGTIKETIKEVKNDS